jgi:nitrate reductase alpha subunit
MLKIRRHKNITHTAVAIVAEQETPTTKMQIAKIAAIHVGVVAVVVAAKYAVAKMLNDNENDN